MKWLILLLLLSACTQTQEVTFGALFGMSGSHAYYGEEARRGVVMAVEEINRNASVPLKIIFEDTKADPKKAVLSAQKLLTQNIHGLITFSGASAAQAVAPLSNEKEVVQVELVCYAPGCHTKDDFLFRISGSAKNEPEYMANDLIRRNKTNVALLYIKNDLGESMRNFFSQEFEKQKGTILYEDFFLQEETVFSPILAKIPAVDAIVVFSYGEIAYILKAREELGKKTLIYGFETTKDPRTIQIAGENALQEVLFSYPGNVNTDAYNAFSEAYTLKYGSDPPIYPFKAYDATKLLYFAVQKCKYKDNGSCIKSQLERVKNYEGASNSITFDNFGDIEEEIFHTELFEGEWEITD